MAALAAKPERPDKRPRLEEARSREEAAGSRAPLAVVEKREAFPEKEDEPRKVDKAGPLRRGLSAAASVLRPQPRGSSLTPAGAPEAKAVGDQKKPRLGQSPSSSSTAVPSRTLAAPPPWRNGAADGLDWGMTVPKNSNRRDITLLELQIALGPLAEQPDAPRAGDLLKALALIDIKDLTTLRIQVDVLMRFAQREHEPPKKPGSRSAQSARGSAKPFPLPNEEGVLMALSERVLDLERLKQLTFAYIPYVEQYSEVLLQLLTAGIGSVEALATSRSKIDARGLSTDQVESLDRLHEAAAAQAKETDLERIARRSELVQYGSNAFLFTAPHNIWLRRDGLKPHMREAHTTDIAQRMAAELDGTALCWTWLENWRTTTQFALGKRRMDMHGEKSVNEALDPANRDPNYLHEQELQTSPWHCGLREWASRCRKRTGSRQLHVDVHGCQDPPKYPTHMVIGLGAMRRRIEELPKEQREEELRRLHFFADSLSESLGPAIAPITGLIPSQVVTITGLATGYSDGEQEFLTGVCSDPERRTLTQQSISHIGVSHAMQMEISGKLRQLLMAEPKAIDSMARTIRHCWKQALAREEAKRGPRGAGSRR